MANSAARSPARRHDARRSRRRSPVQGGAASRQRRSSRPAPSLRRQSNWLLAPTARDEALSSSKRLSQTVRGPLPRPTGVRHAHLGHSSSSFSTAAVALRRRWRWRARAAPTVCAATARRRRATTGSRRSLTRACPDSCNSEGGAGRWRTRTRRCRRRGRGRAPARTDEWDCSDVQRRGAGVVALLPGLRPAAPACTATSANCSEPWRPPLFALLPRLRHQAALVAYPTVATRSRTSERGPPPLCADEPAADDWTCGKCKEFCSPSFFFCPSCGAAAAERVRAVLSIDACSILRSMPLMSPLFAFS